MDGTGALPPLARLRRWTRWWAGLAIAAALPTAALAVLDRPVWASVAGGVAMIGATCWLGCALNAWTLSSTLASLQRGEALASWTLRPETAARFHAASAAALRRLAWGFAVGVLALGLGLAWAGHASGFPADAALGAGLAGLAAVGIAFGWPRVEALDPRAPEAARVAIGPDCGLVGGVVLVWSRVGIRPTGAEVVRTAGDAMVLRIHARQRMRHGEAATTVDLPVEPADAARAEAAARALATAFGAR